MDMNMKSRTNLVASRLTLFSIISLVIIETCTLLLVEDYIIFCYNHLVQSDYSRGTKFQNGFLAFCQCYAGSAN